MTIEREHLLDELARCYMRAAFNRMLADPTLLQENAAGPDQRHGGVKGSVQRADHTPIRSSKTS